MKTPKWLVDLRGTMRCCTPLPTVHEDEPAEGTQRPAEAVCPRDRGSDDLPVGYCPPVVIMQRRCSNNNTVVISPLNGEVQTNLLQMSLEMVEVMAEVSCEVLELVG